MRMVIAQDLRPARARCPMRIDQRLRVDLEMRLWADMDIRGRERLANPVPLPDKDTATFERMGLVGMSEDHP